MIVPGQTAKSTDVSGLGVPGGRLSLLSTDPHAYNDLTGSTLYYLPTHQGGRVPVPDPNDQTIWLDLPIPSSGVSIAITGGGFVASTNYDVGIAIDPASYGSYPNYTLYLMVNAWRNSGQAITGASNATPIRITANAHGLFTGDEVYVSGVLGNLGANGKWIITKFDANNFDLNSSVGTGAYTAGTGWFNGRVIGFSPTLNIGGSNLPGRYTFPLFGAFLVPALYLGTFRTVDSPGVGSEDSRTRRYLWNVYNRILKPMYAVDATGHTYTTASLRAWNNNITIGQTGSEYVIGLPQVIPFTLWVEMSGTGAAQSNTLYVLHNQGVAAGAPNSSIYPYGKLTRTWEGTGTLDMFLYGRIVQQPPGVNSNLDWSGYNKLQVNELGAASSGTYSVMSLNTDWQG